MRRWLTVLVGGAACSVDTGARRVCRRRRAVAPRRRAARGTCV